MSEQNLAEIVGGDDPEHRVVSFDEGENCLWVTEQCDQYFAQRLDLEQLDRLIAFLTEQRQRIAAYHPFPY